MGMTMTQKILAAHAGLDHVEAGQLIEAELDLVLGNDITSPVAIKEMEKMNVDGVFHKDKIALVPDHFVPNKDIKSAQHCKCVREFARRNEITNYFEGKGIDSGRRCDHRRRLPHLHLWRAWRVFHRGWQYRYGGWYGYRQSLVQSTVRDQIPSGRQACRMGER